jgi:hypothetical protein
MAEKESEELGRAWQAWGDGEKRENAGKVCFLGLMARMG